MMAVRGVCFTKTVGKGMRMGFVSLWVMMRNGTSGRALETGWVIIDAACAGVRLMVGHG